MPRDEVNVDEGGEDVVRIFCMDFFINHIFRDIHRLS
jgi:hypothetical protein